MNRGGLGRYWFLAGLIVLIPIGLLLPEFGVSIKQNKWAVPVCVGAMLGIAGFTMDTSMLAKQSINIRAIAPVIFCTYVLSPAVAYVLACLLAPEGDGHFVAAMMIMAAQASSLASAIALTMMAGGNRELALVCTLISNSTTVVLTPYILRISVDANVEFQVYEMISKMALVVLLPVLIGQILRKFILKEVEFIMPAIKLIPQIIILLFVYTGFASGAGQLITDGSLVVRFSTACILLHLILLGFTLLISNMLKLGWPEKTAVIFCGSQKTLPNGIYIWNNFFQSNPYGAVPLVLYHLFQLVLAILLVPKFEKLNEGDRDNEVAEHSAPVGCLGSVKGK